jgi:hypothetical protein
MTSAAEVVSADYSLWSSSTAWALIIFMIIIFMICSVGISAFTNVKEVAKNWNKYRCSPTIMPFASLYGYDTNENFNFCMGKIFETHSTPYVGSLSSSMSQLTGSLQTQFGAIGSLRNTIASLGGGINIITQEFTERISSFFFNIRLSAIRIKMLFGRMYAILFSVMYMGLSGITGMTSFTNTFLFSFLDTFCFPGETQIEIKNKGHIPIKDVQIGDTVIGSNSRVTGTFMFYAKGQPMVEIDGVLVSTNHYIVYNGKHIKAGEHPLAISKPVWSSNEPLYCLNTDNHRIAIGKQIYLDYDETEEGDNDTMLMIENRINATPEIKNTKYKFTEYAPGCIQDTSELILKDNTIIPIKNAKIGDKLSTGSTIVGKIRREVSEYVIIDGISYSAATLIWDETARKWIRVGEIYPVIKDDIVEMESLIVEPNSLIEINGSKSQIIRDYMELCSPDSEMYYTKHLKK